MRHALFGFLLLTITQVTLASPPAPSTPAARLAGTYERAPSDSASFQVDIQALEDHRVDVQVSASWRHHTGDFSGQATLTEVSGHWVAVVEEDPSSSEDCHLVLVFNRAATTVQVLEDGCSGWHGVGVDLNGQAYRVESQE